MKNKTMTEQGLLKKFEIIIMVFFVVAMGWIIYLSMTRVVTIEGVAADEVHLSGSSIAGSEETVSELLFDVGKADSNYLRIPLPENCKPDSIVIENHYMDQEFKIFIPDLTMDFYREHQLSGNRSQIVSGKYHQEEQGIVLNLKTDQIYECRTIFEDQNLYISFLLPREVYDKIVVIDPAHGGLDLGNQVDAAFEKDLNLKVAEKLKEKLDRTKIKAYYTRMNDSQVDDLSRVELGNGVKPDLYIRLECAYSKDNRIYGVQTVYNADYFIPGFGNVELADLLEREVTTSVKGKALGLLEAGEQDQILLNLKIPATTVKMGYLSNAQERTLLKKDDYADRIAEGIYQAITKRYKG